MVLGLFGKNETKKETIIENEIRNESVFTALNRTNNVTAARVISKQKISVNGARFICKNANFKQIANLNVKVMTKFKGKDSANLVDDIMNELDTKLDEELDQAAGFLGIGGGNKADMKTNVKTSVTNSLKKSITNETLNKLAAEIAVKQDLKLQNLVVDPCGLSGFIDESKDLLRKGTISVAEFRKASSNPCDAECGTIGQDVQIKFVAEQISEKINETIAENKQVQKLKQDIASKQKQKTQGVGEALGDVYRGVGEGVGTAVGGKEADGSVGGIGGGIGEAGEGIGSGIGSAFQGGSMPSIASASVCCVLILGAAAFAMSPAGQNMAKGR
jgi:hypothetical protein